MDRGSLGAIAATWTDAVALGSLHFAWPGWICHAGLSWNPSVHWDFIQNSLAELVSLWALDEAPAEDASGAESSTGAVGAALVELGRLETWMLRFSRGELDSDSLIGNRRRWTAFSLPSLFSRMIPAVAPPFSCITGPTVFSLLFICLKSCEMGFN